MLPPTDPDILSLLPHRPPFLWVDRVLSLSGDAIETVKEIPADLPLFQGHFPGHPVMPGVLLCEAVFQSGAILIGAAAGRHGEAGERFKGGVPLLTRIKEARFKREVRPGDTIHIRVRLLERVGNGWFLKGKVTVNGNTAVRVEFGCTLADSPDRPPDPTGVKT